MKVADFVITNKQRELFQSSNPDMNTVTLEARKIDRAVVEYILKKEGKRENSQNNKAKAYGIALERKTIPLFTHGGYGNLHNMFRNRN